VRPPPGAPAARRLGLRLALAALAALSLAGRAWGASLETGSPIYSPPLYSPGDEVLVEALLLPVAGEKPAPFDLKPSSGLPALGPEADPELRELRLSRSSRGWIVSLRFVPWSPGSGSLPALRVRGLLIPALPYSARSVLGPEDRDPSPPRRQRDPPGTALYLYGLAGLLLILALGGAGAAAYLVPAARALLARRRAALAFRSFVRSLEYLEAEALSAEPAAFFAALSRALRLYLAARGLPEEPSLRSVAALSAAEIAALPGSAFPAPATKERVAALCALADRVRYGGERPGPSALESAVGEVRAIGEENEGAALARV
jgi:hypothetical protein